MHTHNYSYTVQRLLRHCITYVTHIAAHHSTIAHTIATLYHILATQYTARYTHNSTLRQAIPAQPNLARHTPTICTAQRTATATAPTTLTIYCAHNRRQSECGAGRNTCGAHPIASHARHARRAFHAIFARRKISFGAKARARQFEKRKRKSALPHREAPAAAEVTARRPGRQSAFSG